MNNEVLQGIGPRLAVAREAKGLATAEVASKLRLGVRQIEALEADAYDQLPGEVFVRGFIRNYAKLLDLDPEELLPSQEAAVSEQLTVPSTNVAFHPSPIQRWLLLPIGSAILFFALVALLYAWLSSGEQPAAEEPGEVLSSPDTEVVAPQPLVLDQTQETAAASEPAETADASTVAAAPAQAAAPVSPANKPSVIDAAKPVVPPLATVPAKPSIEAAKPATSPVASTPAKPAPVVSVTSPMPSSPAATPVSVPAVKPAPIVASAKPAGSRALVFQPTEDSWVQVVDAKGQRFSKLMRAGSTETVEGMPPFRLVVGNAATMKLSHNGKPVDLKPFIGEKVARFKLADEGATKLNPPETKPADGLGQ